MASDTESPVRTTGADPGTLARRGAVALVAALAVNWVVTFAAIAAAVAPTLDAMNYGPVGLFTTLGVVGATVTYGVLARVVDDPDRTFAVVAAVVLVASLIPDFTVVPAEPGGSLAAGAVLATMHVATAAICVAVLTDLRERY